MRLKPFIVVLFLISIMAFVASSVTGQDEAQGTYLDESGEKKDSLERSDIFDFGSEFEEDKSLNTGLIIGIVAAVFVGGGIVFFAVRKKTRKVEPTE